MPSLPRPKTNVHHATAKAGFVVCINEVKVPGLQTWGFWPIPNIAMGACASWLNGDISECQLVYEYRPCLLLSEIHSYFLRRGIQMATGTMLTGSLRKWKFKVSVIFINVCFLHFTWIWLLSLFSPIFMLYITPPSSNHRHRGNVFKWIPNKFVHIPLISSRLPSTYAKHSRIQLDTDQCNRAHPYTHASKWTKWL